MKQKKQIHEVKSGKKGVGKRGGGWMLKKWSLLWNAQRAFVVNG